MNILVLSCGTGGGHNTAGLAVADEIIKKHSGEINISSVPSQGTEVEIVLPVDIKEE